MEKEQSQVPATHYKFNHYDNPERFSSYWQQLDLILAENPSNILEIGVGSGVIGSYLKNNSKSIYHSFHIAEDLKPDYVGNIKSLPFKDNIYDAVCAFEVLEHLPFKDFSNCLKELGRVSKKIVILSLPHFGPTLKLNFKLPFLKERKLMVKLPWPKTHKFNGQHYWEIGKKGFSTSEILKILRNDFIVKKHFVSFDNPYHHFFVLIKK